MYYFAFSCALRHILKNWKCIGIRIPTSYKIKYFLEELYATGFVNQFNSILKYDKKEMI